MSKYEKLKERYRQEAIDWQTNYEYNDYSWGELSEYGEYFASIGRRYGLLTEFRENGIC